MPWDKVMGKFKKGKLKAGGHTKVTDRKQAVAIMLNMQAEAAKKHGEGSRAMKAMRARGAK